MSGEYNEIAILEIDLFYFILIFINIIFKNTLFSFYVGMIIHKDIVLAMC